ncbi:Atlastin, partial [Operophtera brumata]
MVQLSITHESVMLKLGIKHGLSMTDIQFTSFYDNLCSSTPVTVKEEQVAVKEETTAEEELCDIEESTCCIHVDNLMNIDQSSLDEKTTVEDEFYDNLCSSTPVTVKEEHIDVKEETTVEDELIDTEESTCCEHVDNLMNIEQSLLDEKTTVEDEFYNNLCSSTPVTVKEEHIDVKEETTVKDELIDTEESTHLENVDISKNHRRLFTEEEHGGKMSAKIRGEGLQVVSVGDDGSYRACAEALRGVAARAELRALPVAVPAAQRDGSWIGTDDEPLDGFSWRGGWQRNTTGILLWSEPIVVTQKIDGTTKKVVVLLMDTQGTFDNSSTVRECTTIFALSTLISSVQIYNLAQQIKEDDLQHLQLFTQYGKLAVSEADAKPFQSLIFRVRDWMCPFEHPYGATGGEKYLESILKIDRSKNEELRELREHIRNSFDSISCFLMPHPGFAVEDPNFSGRLSVINGQEIALGDLLSYFNSYIEIFNSDELPTPVSILKSVNKGNQKSAKQAAVYSYNNHMSSVMGPHSCLHPASLRSEHQQALRSALEEINNACNDSLVNESYAVYTHKMDSKCTPSLASILVIPWLVKVLVMIPKFHQQYRKEAIDHF